MMQEADPWLPPPDPARRRYVAVVIAAATIALVTAVLIRPTGGRGAATPGFRLQPGQSTPRAVGSFPLATASADGGPTTFVVPPSMYTTTTIPLPTTSTTTTTTQPALALPPANDAPCQAIYLFASRFRSLASAQSDPLRLASASRTTLLDAAQILRGSTDPALQPAVLRLTQVAGQLGAARTLQDVSVALGSLFADPAAGPLSAVVNHARVACPNLPVQGQTLTAP